MSKRLIAPFVVAVVLFLGGGSQAQQSATAPPILRFDAASVKPSARTDPRGDISVWQFVPNGDLMFGNATLHLIVTLAYKNDIRFSDQLLLGTQPVLQQRFDIQAKNAGGKRDQTRPMLLTLLEERFNLRTHTEMREIPVYALEVTRPGRIGSNLRETTVDCSRYDFSETMKDLAPACAQYGRRDVQKARLRESGPMALLIRRLEMYADRPIEDRTGLTGMFEWETTFAIDRNPAVDSDFQSLDAALADQLGLKLVPTRAVREVRIIDNIESPTPN
jgi:uncharacterized protein (TIGR03435 family)